MTVRGLRASVTLATAAALALALGGAAAAAATPSHNRVPSGPAVQEFYWQWSDGAPFAKRTFMASDFPNPATMPRLVFTVVPAKPTQLVYLQFFQDGEWSTENIVRTGATGIAEIAVDPFCKNGSWCDGTYRYRLNIDGVIAPLTINFFEH